MAKKLSVRQAIAMVGNPLKTGDSSPYFQEFCKKYGISKEDLEVRDPSFVDRIKLKLAYLDEHREQCDILLAFYKSTGARGLNMLDRLINLRAEILQREKYLQENGTDPLADRVLMSARRDEFEIVKFLEKIRYDKEKTEMLISTKKESDDDIAFIVEVPPRTT